jgi:hypothetical protein
MDTRCIRGDAGFFASYLMLPMFDCFLACPLDTEYKVSIIYGLRKSLSSVVTPMSRLFAKVLIGEDSGDHFAIRILGTL